MDRKIIITVLSLMRKPINGVPPQQFNYISDCAAEIKTDWTNAAGLMYLLKTVPDITDVICMCSEAVDNDDHKNRVRDIISSSGCEGINPRFIRYKDNTSFVDITNDLINEFTFKNSDIIYLDTTGGFRPVAYSLVYLFRYFEYMNITIEKAIYSSLNGDEGKIEDIKDTFRMFDLINGTHEFTSSGDPQTLIRFFENNKNPKINSLLNQMTVFYDAISLCRLNGISSVVKKLNKTMMDLQSDKPNSFDEALFINLIPAIRAKFCFDKNQVYLSLIRWCLANNLLQQAVTIYVEKLPRAYFKELKFFKMLVPEEELGRKMINPGADAYADYFMTSSLDESIEEHLREMETFVDDMYTTVRWKSVSRDFDRMFSNTSYSQECIEKFKIIVKLRDMFYENDGSRVRYVQNQRKARELLARINLREMQQLPNSIDAFLRNLKNSHYMIVLGDAPAAVVDASNNSRSVINNYNRAVHGGLLSGIDSCLEPEMLRMFRLDYLYAKYIRNQINHASDAVDDEPEFKRVMHENFSYNFPEDNNFSASDIKSFLQSSVKYIEDIHNTIHK